MHISLWIITSNKNWLLGNSWPGTSLLHSSCCVVWPGEGSVFSGYFESGNSTSWGYCTSKVCKSEGERKGRSSGEERGSVWKTLEEVRRCSVGLKGGVLGQETGRGTCRHDRNAWKRGRDCLLCGIIQMWELRSDIAVVLLEAIFILAMKAKHAVLQTQGGKFAKTRSPVFSPHTYGH